ncbi:unnamed protein product [Sphenostylis stenocarpa]|uniref:TIR domain-containing protein n=1 Tax=Sphenostylis stenocarpa TaxID=92480 RepID=A0AA86SQF7_9FABA|nr:unnamed protein product [Sphenostylis stenocarpa]
MSSIFAKGYSFLIPNFEVGEADRLPKKVAKDTRIHEVFLSFRGKDTRASFTAHLYAALRNAGILAFKDDTSLLRGDHISPALLKAIQVSEISVVVFSTNYATSAWCMQELETIMKCHRNTGQVVVPVFYYVDPSEVRHQTGGFGSAFRSLERRILAEENEVSLRMSMFKRKFNLQNWKEALAEAAGISGVVVEYARDENEAIKNIVENVIRLLDKTELFVADNQVGVECRIQDIIQLLDLETPNNVLLLGMWGMGGIGKTTIAKAVYNRIGRNFEGKKRSLVTVDAKNKLGMHDLVRDMGREIIRAESPKEPEMRSRLWFHEDVLDVLSKETGTKAIEGLTLNLPKTNTQCLSTEAFKEMKKLRLLQLVGVQLDGDFKHLSKYLTWLCWHEFPLACIPANFYQRSLVSIELERSNVTHLWEKAQMKLKILNLSHSHCLTQTPDFSNLPNLEKLILKDCSRLSEVSHTIAHLNKVLLINLEDCINLCNLPRSIYKLKTLETLILYGCLKIDKLEEDMEQMESLTTLIADKTTIKTMPLSIVRSKSIRYISLCGYEGYSCDVFPSIIWSSVSPTNTLSSRVQTFASKPFLVSSDVLKTSSSHLLCTSKDLPKLQSLVIEFESEIRLFQDARSILDALCATKFEELESTTSQMHDMNDLTLIGCSRQVDMPESKRSLRSLLIQMGRSSQVTSILKQKISQVSALSLPLLHNMSTSEWDDCLFPNDSYPDWLTFGNEGSSVVFEVPRVNQRTLQTIMFHIHYSSPDNITSDGLKNLLVINHTKTTIQLYKKDALISFKDEEWQRVLPNIEPGNKVEVAVFCGSRLTVSKTIVYLIYESMDEKL